MAMDDTLRPRTGRCVKSAIMSLFADARKGLQLETVKKQNEAETTIDEAEEAETDS